MPSAALLLGDHNSCFPSMSGVHRQLRMFADNENMAQAGFPGRDSYQRIMNCRKRLCGSSCDILFLSLGIYIMLGQ